MSIPDNHVRRCASYVIQHTSVETCTGVYIAYVESIFNYRIVLWHDNVIGINWFKIYTIKYKMYML